jgi:hypothetical protein
MKAKCQPDERILSALLHTAEQIGRRAAPAYMKQIKRDRRGRVTAGYSISEAHRHVTDTIDAYARCKINNEEALSVVTEYGVMKARFNTLNAYDLKLRSKRKR